MIARLQAAREGKLTVVAAPAGSGKTTLVRQWLADVPAVAWLALEADDSEPIRFWSYVISAARAFGSQVGRESLAQLEQPLAMQSGLRPVLSAFVNELARVEQPAVLVLEDYHLIVAEQVHIDASFEGWAAGLRILALALQGDERGNVLERILSGSGPHRRELVDYFPLVPPSRPVRLGHAARSASPAG